jgi:hypothetical protein
MGTYTRYHVHREYRYLSAEQKRFYKRQHRRMMRREHITLD